MRRFISYALAPVGALILFAAAPALVGAHETRGIADGQFRVVVGFLEEPAFAGERNGLDLRVTLNDGGTPAADGTVTRTPVEGLDETLQAEIIYGDQTMELPLRPAFHDPGAYRSYFFPIAAGDYTFRIFGTINGVEVDESFTSSPEGFDSVQPVEPYQFPKPAASGETRIVTGAATTGSSGLGLGFGVDGLLVVIGFAALAVYQLARRRPRIRVSDRA